MTNYDLRMSKVGIRGGSPSFDILRTNIGDMRRKRFSAVKSIGKFFGSHVSVFPSVPQEESIRLSVIVFLDYGCTVTIFLAS